MDDLDSSHFDADTNGFSLIDASAFDDDFLFSSSSEANAVDNQGDILEGEHVDKPSDMVSVQRPRKPGKCNLRKSLAWDSAFFTSAGVLDADELSSILEGAETGQNQNHPLPGIQEELSKSTDTMTTFESDSLTLESLEADLFCDIRASIQRSNKSTTSGKKNLEEELGNGSSSTGQPSSGDIVKSRLASRKLIPAAQGPVASRVLKSNSVSKQVNKPIVKGKESSSTLLRPPAATGKPSLEGTVASKRMSVGTSRTKSEIHHAGNVIGVGKAALISKGPRQFDSRNTSQRVAAASKLSSASSVLNRTAINSSHSSFDSSSSSSNTSTTKKPCPQNNLGVASSLSSSESIRKSLLDVRRKIDKNVNLPPGSKIRTPSRVLKGKSQTGLCKLSAYVKSTSNTSPSNSPASSISEWSIESSSSNATVNLNPSSRNCSATEDIAADRNPSQNLQPHSNDRSLDSHDNQVTKQPPTGTILSQAGPGSAKPSGLRLPSPKIGFFDGAKTGTKTPTGSARSRSAIPSNVLKSATGNNSPGPSNKTKPGSAVKLSMSAVGRPGTTKLNPQKSHVSPKLIKQLQDDTVDLPSVKSAGSFPEVSKIAFAKSHPGPELTKQYQDVTVDLPIDNKTDSFSEDSESTSAHSHHAVPKLTKQLQVDVPYLPSGNDSGTFTEVSITTLAKNHASPTKQLQDDTVDLPNGNDSGTSPEVSTTTLAQSHARLSSTKQFLDNIVDLPSANDSDNISEVSITTLAKGDAISVLSNQVQNDIVDKPSDIESVTFSEISVDMLSESTSESSVVAEATDGVKQVDPCLEIKNDSTGLPEDLTSMIAEESSDPAIELPKSTTKSALEQNGKVSEDTYRENHSSEISFITEDLSDVMLKTSNTRNFDDQPETNSILKENYAVTKEVGEENESQVEIDDVIEVANGGPHFMCAPSLPDNEVSPGSRTHFAVKNLVADVVTADAFVKIDAMPSSEKTSNFQGSKS